MLRRLLVVSGAPGSGKTKAVDAFLALESEFIALDIDWLIEEASELSGTDIHTDANSWTAYAQLWFSVLQSVERNGAQPIFFTPNSQADLESFGVSSRYESVETLLLDCSDEVRITRLQERGWSEDSINEAISDAQELRDEVETKIDTNQNSPEQVATHIRNWAHRRNSE